MTFSAILMDSGADKNLRGFVQHLEEKGNSDRDIWHAIDCPKDAIWSYIVASQSKGAKNFSSKEELMKFAIDLVFTFYEPKKNEPERSFFDEALKKGLSGVKFAFFPHGATEIKEEMMRIAMNDTSPTTQLAYFMNAMLEDGYNRALAGDRLVRCLIGNTDEKQRQGVLFRIRMLIQVGLYFGDLS